MLSKVIPTLQTDATCAVLLTSASLDKMEVQLCLMYFIKDRQFL